METNQSAGGAGMNPEQQRIAIAEACGLPKPYSRWSGGIANTLCHSVIVKDGWREAIPIPDYLNDLNAMHEAEESLHGNQYVEYTNSLIEIEGSLFGIRTTAAERAEAFLKTLNLWKL
jgi:hypothetical protein